MKTYESSTPNA